MPKVLPKPKKFDLNAKRFFLTYSQCTLSSKELGECLLRQLTDIEWIVIAMEKHENGDPHLHVAISFDSSQHIRNPRHFDISHPSSSSSDELVYHPKIEGMRNFRKTIAYISKEDQEPWTHGDIDIEKIKSTPNENTSALVALAASKGAKFTDLFTQYPGFCMMNKNKIDSLTAYYAARLHTDSLRPWEGISTTCQSQVLGIEVLINWLNTAIRQPRVHRSPQLYLWGPPGIGKSRLIQELSKFLMIYHIPRDEEFYDQWEDKTYDLAVLDEFKASKRIQWLNSWLDGYPLPLRMKGRQYLKIQNIPTIIISNYPLTEVYKASIARDALEQRFIFVNITEDFTILWEPLTAPSSPITVDYLNPQ